MKFEQILFHFGYCFHLGDYVPRIKYDKALIKIYLKGIHTKCLWFWKIKKKICE